MTSERTATAVRFDPDLHRRIVEAAEERGWSMNTLIGRAAEFYLDHLVPINEIHFTRPPGGPYGKETTDGE